MLILIFVQAGFSSPALSVESNGSCLASSVLGYVPTATEELANIDRLTQEILLMDIELEKFSIRFRLANNVQGRWRGLRYFLSQEANAALTDAGLIKGVSIRYDALARPTVTTKDGKTSIKAHPLGQSALTSTLYPQMIGQIIGASGSGLELGINGYHTLMAIKHGYGRGYAIRYAEAMKVKLLAHIKQRDDLINNSHYLSESEKKLLRAEGDLLRDVVNLALIEFVKFYVDSCRFRMFQDSLYTLDIAKNTIGALGNLINIIGIDRHKPKLNGPGFMLTTISGGLIILTPILSRGFGKLDSMSRYRALRNIISDVEMVDIHRFELDRLRLARLGQQVSFSSEVGQQNFIKRLDIYEQHQIRCEKQLDLATREVRAGVRVATENVASGIIIGSTKLGLGVPGMVAGFKYPHNHRAADPLIAAGSISYCSGTSYALLDNIRIQVVNERNRRKLKRSRRLPVQVFADRINDLERLELSFKKLGT